MALLERCRHLLDVLGAQPSSATGLDTLLGLLDRPLEELGNDGVWLALAALTGRFPDLATVTRVARARRLDGAMSAFLHELENASPIPMADGTWPRVHVVTDGVLVDVHHTARTSLATGIQRVARAVVRRWCREQPVQLVGWTPDGALRRLTPTEHACVLGGPHDPGQPGGVGEPDGALPSPSPTRGAAPTPDVMPRAPDTVPPSGGGSPEVLVPWGCAYVFPEVRAERDLTGPFASFLTHSRCATTVIGFDTVTLTSPETVRAGHVAVVAGYLAAIAQADRLAAISASAATEFRGWRQMLTARGLLGPEIQTIELPAEVEPPSPAAMARARELLCTGDLPLVLCVGSFEPRKNHLAVLHAAELLWRRGERFSLAFVGANAWHSDRFATHLRALQDAGRPVHSVSGLADDLLWAAYRLARYTVYPSLHEGFGLPVAESLACGTPVVTASFGSMEEVGTGGGALLVDPRDDHALAGTMATLLNDDGLHARLAAQARARPRRTWADYAGELWNYATAGAALARPVRCAAAP